MPPKILVVSGPTATGKTELAVDLALRLNGEVVSADSMQIYRRMNIGTAKPGAGEMRGVPHHMLDVADPEEDFSVSRYVEMARQCISGILERGKLPILCGGTGLYIDSLISGRTFAAFSPDSPLRGQLEARYDAEGGEAMLEELAAGDPESAGRLHPNDRKRIVRALEVLLSTGKPISRHNAETRSLPPSYEAVTVTLSFKNREHLRERIGLRVDRMMEQGLAEEVRSLLDSGVPEHCTAMQAIGYKEMAAALRTGGSMDAAAEEIKLRTRQYAKRQLSWFRRCPDARWILWDREPDFDMAVRESLDFLRSRGL